MPEDVLAFDLPIDREDLKEFALAVGSNDPVHFDPDAAREQGLPDVLAPPTFTVRQAHAVSREERERRLGVALDPARVLHGEQEFVYRRLPVAGEVLKGTMRVARDFTKEGERGGRMRFVTYESVFTDADDEEVLTASYTLLEIENELA